MSTDGRGAGNDARCDEEVARQQERELVARQNEENLNKFRHAAGEFKKSADKACILFADLVGSTAFKSRHNDIEGIEKVYTHNRCVQEVVECEHFRGEVAKYLGDGVLAFFEGPDAAQRGLQAALAIVSRIGDENAVRNWHFPKSITTRIGVEFGPVWMMLFKTGKVRDPQGTTVDLASRLCSLGGTNQILVTEAAFAAAGGSAQFPHRSFSELCTVRGILEPIRLVSVASRPELLQPIALPGGASAMPTHIADRLKAASERWERANAASSLPEKERHLQAAIDIYRQVLSEDQLNFDANFYLAEHLALNFPNHKQTRSKRLEEAYGHLCIATSERPQSCYAWKLLSWVRFRQFLESDLTNCTLLDEAIRYARHALNIAESNKDAHGAAVSKIYLIIYLNKLVAHCNDSAQCVRSLQEVQAFEEEVRATISGGLGKHLESKFLLGVAMTMNAKKQDKSKTRELLDDAEKLDPENRLVLELKLELLDGVDAAAASRR